MKNKRCRGCNACKQMYSRFGFSYYDEYKMFYCIVKENVTSVNDVCEQWTPKVKEKADFSAERFDGAEQDIKRLMELLKDADEYIRQHPFG